MDYLMQVRLLHHLHVCILCNAYILCNAAKEHAQGIGALKLKNLVFIEGTIPSDWTVTGAAAGS